MIWVKPPRLFGQQGSGFRGAATRGCSRTVIAGPSQMADMTTAGPLLHQVDRLFVRIRARDRRGIAGPEHAPQYP